jgi:4'-phosphopantetheinyl transferase EntD
VEIPRAPDLDEPARLLAWLRAAAPPGCAVAGGLIAGRADAGYPGEAQVIARAVAQRGDEFRAGRAFAREALALTGAAASEILRGAEGEPLWPAGYVGSITHSDRLAFAVVAPASRYRGLGIDVERIGALEPALARYVCAQDESLAASAPGVDAATRLLVAKEAAIKGHAAAGGGVLDFLQIHIVFDRGSDGYRAYGRDAAARELFLGRLHWSAETVAAIGHASSGRSFDGGTTTR